MDFWHLLMEILLLLGTAFVLGAVAQRFKQSAIIGYLLAGILLGPLLFNASAVADVAELGVALLLFSIGLEFSFKRLVRLGKVALGIGGIQIIATMVVFALLSLFLSPLPQALALGAIAALSSTAVVLRVLIDRSEIDAVHGRTALGVLLLQDIAVVPMVLMMAIMAQGGNTGDVIGRILHTLAAAGGLIAVFYILFYWLVPWVLTREVLHANRELVILLAILAATGSTWGAHAIGLSPALGAFLAGMLLGESPSAAQIRSDVGSLRTLFVTLFFTSIGMLMEPSWLLHYGPLAAVLVAGVVVGKAGIIYLAARLFSIERRYALAVGFTLAQIGEFSFVLTTTAHEGGVLGDSIFALVVTANIMSLFAAPYLVTYALPMADFILRRIRPLDARKSEQPAEESAEDPSHPSVIVIGYGPAGRQVIQALQEHGITPGILELNPKAIGRSRDTGLHIHVGDATSAEVLTHAGVPAARAVIVTVPDPRTARDITSAIHDMAPEAHLIVRSRFQRACHDLKSVGATVVVDEETNVGRLLALEVLTSLELGQDISLAYALCGRRPVSPPSRGGK